MREEGGYRSLKEAGKREKREVERQRREDKVVEKARKKEEGKVKKKEKMKRKREVRRAERDREEMERGIDKEVVGEWEDEEVEIRPREVKVKKAAVKKVIAHEVAVDDDEGYDSDDDDDFHDVDDAYTLEQERKQRVSEQEMELWHLEDQKENTNSK